MNGLSIKKVIFFIAFLALAAVSCWATQLSLNLSLPSWPQAICWVVTVAFFLIASLGTKLISDSFNSNIYVESRGTKLVFGVLIVVVFWLIFSMPTNTHTFFYRNAGSAAINSDITSTKNYLDQLRNNTVTEAKILSKCNQFDNDIKIKLGELEAEIKNDENPGFGPVAKAILRDFAQLLGVAKVDPLSYNGTSVQARERLVDAYRKKIYLLADTKKQNIRSSMIDPSQDVYKRVASLDWDNLDLIEKEIIEGNININNPNDVEEINRRLSKSYATIKSYQLFVNFNDGDKAIYTAANPVTKIKSMLSVFHVWKDFVKGGYAGHGLIYWVILSVLVDVGAFVFFVILFKEEY